LKEAKSLDGMMLSLARKHRGNVHDKGIVTITSKSVAVGNVRNVADFVTGSRFTTDDEPGQWICWDFHEMRVRPTHYTIWCRHMKSWVVESSLDSEHWKEIDRKTDNSDLAKEPWKASFAVSDSTECRFIRLTQTGKNHIGLDEILIHCFEVFGILLECQ
jgi:hypothetical protein